MDIFIIEKKQLEQTGWQQVFDMWENEVDRLTDICVECNSVIDNEVIIPRVGDKLYSAYGLFTVVDVIIWSYTMDSAIFVVEPVIKRKKI